MSDLVDLRAKITPRTHAVLSAVSQASGRDISELVREITDLWADERVHEAKVIARVLRSEGIAAAQQGEESK